jgi:hypothetical protein
MVIDELQFAGVRPDDHVEPPPEPDPQPQLFAA